MLAYEIGLEELLEEDHPLNLGQLPALRYFKSQQEGPLGRNAAVLCRVNRLLSISTSQWHRDPGNQYLEIGTESMLDVERICFHLTLGGPH